MPLIIMSGYPCSGKSSRASELESYFKEHNLKTHILSEFSAIKTHRLELNQVFGDSNKEKLIRGILKSETQRLLCKKDLIVILDASNYIKGYRYELYCISKLNKTTQCTVQCEIATDLGWEWNQMKPESEQYSKENYNALRLRFEEPDSRNRWDSPLFVIQPNDDLPFGEIYQALCKKKPPKPNQSTEIKHVNPTNFAYDLDCITQEIINAFHKSQKEGFEGNLKVPKYEDEPLIISSTRLSISQLSSLRNQFINYIKLNPCEIKKIGILFIHYLNNNST